MIKKADLLARLLQAGRENPGEDPFVITPSPGLDVEDAQGSASVDLRLGTWFLSLRQARMTHLSIDGSASNAQLTKSHYVPYGEDFVLHPGGFVLGVTLEWLRMPSTLAAYVIGKSSWGRRGLIIATATGVHPGFRGCLTLELSNVGEIPIQLRPGMRICQLFVHSVESDRPDLVDRSQFIGKRRPILGALRLDRIALSLANADKK